MVKSQRQRDSNRCSSAAGLRQRRRAASIKSLSSTAKDTPSGKTMRLGILPKREDISTVSSMASRLSPSTLRAQTRSPSNHKTASRRQLTSASCQTAAVFSSTESLDESDVKIKTFNGGQFLAQCAFFFGAGGDDFLQSAAGAIILMCSAK